MLSIAVCDDEIVEAVRIEAEIKAILLEMKTPCIIRRFDDGEALLKTAEDFDLIFLDIMMAGMDGMETAKRFRERAYDKMLVFISASREYVFDAYEVEASWYLLKPVNRAKLRKVLERAVKRYGASSDRYMMISRDREKKKIDLNEVYYFEIRGRVVEIHGAGKENPFVKESLCRETETFYGQIGALEKELGTKGFFRCHKSYLVNLKYVSGYDRQTVTLDNGERLFIAKRRYEAFCKEMLKYMKESGGMT